MVAQVQGTIKQGTRDQGNEKAGNQGTRCQDGIAGRDGNAHTVGMTLKSAALLAFIGTLLTTVVQASVLVLHLLMALRGAEAMMDVLNSCIYAFAWLTLTLFFF